jgi:alpha-beta hydrolase superfamily lysophospholipase
VTKSFTRSLKSCQETFFSPDLPEADLLRYQSSLAACSPARLLDLGQLNKELPLPRPSQAALAGLALFVGGGESDRVVDVPAVQEAAAWLGDIEARVWPGVAHDCMLDTRWETAAASILEWLEGP